ncbi:probable maleylacetoacetate isomerase 2 [Anastrepha ludens]|uniref:probable maleylacetoacetate isomerase 2 n=1 Tax=Anastrepha ludens TaxID=28586 RepID=UPI0023B10D2F|nr:probable maleylacetoacetate isomerase 2 [Anastrepha ludens]XP_053945539.1 probable maleylacetoacetate isomerase 2 [Anastrepha ludens]XP_053945540.1 probable maleylacetoacetate isomerase 2 [Anastrepha ludens]XP_053945541.1 probable maleylacetoacetate isomerase 2 [Anastrepha ludens]
MSVTRCSRLLLQSSLFNGGVPIPSAHHLNNHLRISAKHVSTTSISSSPSPSNQGTKPLLYSYWRSSCSWRVRIALNLKKIPYETIAINLMGEQHGDEYRVVNPMKQVPTLLIDGYSIIESVAIMQYLEETRPQPPLLPPDAYERTKVHEVVEIICSGIQPLQNLNVRKYVGKEKSEEWAQHWISRGFQALEKILSTSAGKYCLGNEITMADCCLLPQVFNAKGFQVDMNQYPTITRIASELETIPAFSAAHPKNQPDCPTEYASNKNTYGYMKSWLSKEVNDRTK